MWWRQGKKKKVKKKTLTKKRPQSQYPRCETPDVESAVVPIRAFSSARIQIRKSIPSTSDEKVIRDHNPRHRTEENTPAAEDGDESTGFRDVVPRTNGHTDDSDEVASSSNIDPFRAESREIHTRGDTIQHLTESQLTGQEAHGREKGARPSSRRERALLDEQEQLERIPDIDAIDGFSRRSDEDAADGGGDDEDGCGDGLAE